MRLIDYHRSFTGDRWVRILNRWQLGWHPQGRFRNFSERYPDRFPDARPWPTLRIGRTLEVSATRLTRSAQ